MTEALELMHTEQRLKASLKEVENLKAALDEHAIVAITDPRGKITYVNDKFCAISKYSRDELLGQDHRIINSGYHSTEFIRSLWATIMLGQVWHGEIKNEAKDGSFYWVDTTIVPFLDGEGKAYQYVAIRADVTERKRAEEEIKKLNADLEERVRQRTNELEAANRELEAFSYSISHDLRAPLRAMAGFTRILETQFAGQVPEEALHAMERIRTNAVKMGQLIDGLLDFASLGRRALSKQTVAPTTIARTVFEELRAELNGRRVDIEIAELPCCEADGTLLKQVFANLLSNALKYTRDRDPAEIRVGWRQATSENQYFVQDNGAGFDPEYASKLFHVFQRLHRADQFEGTGVGLAIAHRIIERHGGRIWGEGRVDLGAIFYFTLEKAVHGN